MRTLFNTLYVSVVLGIAAIDCGTVEAPENGEVSFSSTTYNSTAYFSCNDGYVLVGNETVTCLASGIWSLDASAECAREYSYSRNSILRSIM